MQDISVRILIPFTFKMSTPNIVGSRYVSTTSKLNILNNTNISNLLKLDTQILLKIKDSIIKNVSKNLKLDARLQAIAKDIISIKNVNAVEVKHYLCESDGIVLYKNWP